jgi:DNA-binding NtrC family response regulator
MVYGIVKQSGGHIGAESEVGRGTKFHILFPVVDELLSAVEPEVAIPTRGQGQTILLAEDEVALRESIAGYLTRHGYNVLEASNGNEALQVAQRYGGRIHVLLTDVVMPRMDGTELASKLARIRPGTITLFMSGYADHRLEETPTIHHPVLHKPLNLDALLETIGGVTKQSS